MCESHHEGMGTWLTEGDVYKEWKAGGSFAWLHGEHVSHMLSMY